MDVTKHSDAEPLVTVMVITYNHARFLRQTLDSVLNQKTNFKFNIHVIDDASNDGSKEIFLDYKQRYPGQIELFINEKNIGFEVTQKNFIRGFKTLKAKYISILEGDDYWGYTGKLQRQVDFLEQNPRFVAFTHDTVKFLDDETFPSERFLAPEERPEHTVNHLIRIESFFHTTTAIYRNVLRDCVPKKFIDPFSCDIFNAIAHADHGPFYYEKRPWSYYRAHRGGRFSNMNIIKAWFFNIDGLRRYNEWLGYRYLKDFSVSIARYSRHVLKECRSKNLSLTWQQKLKLRTLVFCYGGLSWLLATLTLPMSLYRRLRQTFVPFDFNHLDWRNISAASKNAPLS